MKKAVLKSAALGALILTGALAASQGALAGQNPNDPPPPENNRAGGVGPVILVMSHGESGLYYDSIALTPVPYDSGPFQELVPTMSGLETEFGPGDQEYVGGRWWIDAVDDDIMGDDDVYFVCPLFGPGRENP